MREVEMARAKGPRWRSARGAAMSEMVILLPLLLVMLLASIDFGRLVFAHQVMVDLTREAANLVSRGGTTDQAFAATFRASDSLDVRANGGIIISAVRRRDVKDGTPWIFDQQSRGAMGKSASKVGRKDGPAKIPNIASIPDGVTITAVEILYPFDPVFDVSRIGLNPFPDVLYDAAFF